MSVLKYKFVSPGVFVNEIDNSQIPDPTPARGPVVIGRTRRGPSMRPIAVNSFSEYIETFGDPVPGGQGGDVWRNGNYTSPMYATYAAEAWLRNGQTATIVRLLGHQDSNLTVGSGEAGWKIASTSASYGLFVIDGPLAAEQAATGTLAAVWYFPEGDDHITLSGSLRRGGSAHVTASNGAFIQSSGPQREFQAIINSGSTATHHTFNFDPDSDQFIRKVFNTNPILTNTTLTTGPNLESYFLGHSFEGAMGSGRTVTGSAAGDVLGIILKLGSVSAGAGAFNTNFSDFQFSSKAANTNWIISQDMRGSASVGFDALDTTYVTKLFKFHSRDGGDWENTNLKISIKDIKSSPNEDVNAYGSFTVLLRDAKDTDNAVQIIEQYSNVNLNPNSENYIAKRIGDTFAEYSDKERRFRSYGEFPNVSKHVRIEMNNEVQQGSTDPRLLPFGFWGPIRPKGFKIHQLGVGSTSGSIISKTFAEAGPIADTGLVSAPEESKGPIILGPEELDSTMLATASFVFPTVALRANSTDSLLSSDKAAFFGYDSTRPDSSTRFDFSNIDILRALPGGVSTTTDVSGSTEIAFGFTLDDLVVNGAADSLLPATYTSGSRKAGTSVTALSGNYTSIIEDFGYNRFTVPMFGGWDGWDVRQSDPIANINLSSGNSKTNYAFNTVRRGIDSCADPEIVDFNLMVVPGVTPSGLTDLMINTCEERGDALAIVDLPNIYLGPQEGITYATFKERLGTLSTIVSDFKIRRKNSSYGATYYPWVQIRDSINNASVWVPPSVVALGTFSSSDRVGELWFAPAGFNRGGLSEGSAGLTVTNVSERLSSDQRDELYEANINPIASFPNEGIVIFGQKTMDATTSALSRINVRRLLIFLKKEISRLANQVLFDQNVPATWGRFQSLVRPVLESVKVRFGLTDYRLLLDETTTTPDLVDRNVLYAKIFLKPARAIEFIALDFIITNTGAGFED